MLYGSIYTGNSYANAFFHKLAWRNGNKKELVFARFAGKPTFVKAVASGLSRGNPLKLFNAKKEIEHLYGTEKCKIHYFKHDKIGIVLYYDKRLFSSSDQKSILIADDKETLSNAFRNILKSKPIVFFVKWDATKILNDLSLITPLETYNTQGFEVLWDIDKINEKISSLVKSKNLSF